MNYEEIQNIVNELLPEFGVACTAVTKVDSEYDPETGMTNSEKHTKGQVVITNIDMRFGSQNNLIEVGDQTLLATASLELEVGTVCTVNDVKYQVIASNSIKPASTIVMYKAHVRKI